MEIVLHPDDRLRQKAKPVQKVNRSVREVLDGMWAALASAQNGLALAATQVGVPRRLVVVKPYEERPAVELINPEFVKREEFGDMTHVEGCLSIPGVYGHVPRYRRVHVRALDRKGHTIWLEAEDFYARLLQHEIDHLDGILFIDKAAKVWRAEDEDREPAEAEVDPA